MFGQARKRKVKNKPSYHTSKGDTARQMESSWLCFSILRLRAFTARARSPDANGPRAPRSGDSGVASSGCYRVKGSYDSKGKHSLRSCSHYPFCAGLELHVSQVMAVLPSPTLTACVHSSALMCTHVRRHALTNSCSPLPPPPPLLSLSLSRLHTHTRARAYTHVNIKKCALAGTQCKY